MKKLMRNYKAKDVDMLTAVLVIVKLCIQRLPELLPTRPGWANPFFTNLETRINNAFLNFLGVDPKKDQRSATITVLGIFVNAAHDLAFFKTQIMNDFSNNKVRRDEILNMLGFTSFLKRVQQHDQEALIELLYRFKQNMTALLQTEITTAGMAVPLITTLKGYADTLKAANVTQETFKESTKTVTQEAVNEFNDIYRIVIGVSKIARDVYYANPVVKSQFVFSSIIKKMNATGKAQSGDVPPVV